MSDLYFLNFKRALVILSSKDMRINIIQQMEEQEIDVNLKFVDSYFQAVTEINNNQHDPFDNIIMNLSFSNQKLNDFIDYIRPNIVANPNFLIEYTKSGDLYPVQLAE